MAATRKQCPACGVTYDETQRFCPRDGKALTDAAQSGGPTPSGDVMPSRPLPTWLQRIPKERLVGIVLVGFVVLLMLAIFAIRQASVYRLRVTFQEGHGLKVGDSVFVRDVEVGEVVGAAFEGDRFTANLAIQSDAAELFRQSSIFYVGYEKVATQKRAIKVLVLDTQSPPVQSGSTIVGEDSPVKIYLTILKRSGPQEASRVWQELKDALQQASDLWQLKDS